MKILRYIAVSFSLYSKIPMPRFEWKEDDMEHSLSFFPFVGLVTGLIAYVIYSLLTYFEVQAVVKAIVSVIIPILVSGGIHLDGYMNTQDALRSYKPTEEKLRILKDPHTGAFAIIGLFVCLLASIASLTVIFDNADNKLLILLGLTLMLSRILSGLSSLLLKKAKEDGMLAGETKNNRKSVIVFLLSQLTVLFACMLYINIFITLMIFAAFLVCLLCYMYMTKKEFGGVTGDTAGYFVTVSETVNLIVIAIIVMTGII